jgi:hypothetical protein
MENLPCPLSLLPFSFPGKSELVARKQGRCAQKASAGKVFHPEIPPCLRKMRRAHRAPSHALRVTHLQGKPSVLGKRTASPPGPGNEARLMVLARNALASGPGNA